MILSANVDVQRPPRPPTMAGPSAPPLFRSPWGNAIRRALFASLTAGLAASMFAAVPAEIPGAATPPQGSATGYFHLELLQGRHYLIAQDGRAFVALGMNHCSDETTATPAGQSAVLANLRAWGFNAGDSQAPAWMRSRIPHTQGITLVPNAAWMTADQFGFRDVFDPSFLTGLERTIRESCAAQRDNPLLIGYFFTDVPRWTLTPPPPLPDESLIVLPEIAPQNWISFFKSLPASAPGRRVWEGWKADNAAAPEKDFLPLIARQLYRQAHGLVRKYDPHHLIFGDRYHENDMPEAVVREALPYIDALAVQPASAEFDPAYYRALAGKFGKPIYLSDHVSSFRTAEFPRTMGQTAATPAEYIAYYRRYVTTALTHPAVIGYQRCQYRSRIRLPGHPPLLKQGLLQLDGRPHGDVIEGVATANRAGLQAAYDRQKLPE